MAEKIGGAATLFRASDSNAANRFPPLPTTIYKLHKNLKKVFDPQQHPQPQPALQLLV